MQGRPFSIETSFTTWLELSLRAAEPGRRWRVVNCGGVSYATYREALIVEELLHHQPDLFILCTGHNEFLEDRSYAHLKRSPAIVRGVVEQASRLRTFDLLASASARLLHDLAGPARDDRTKLGAEVEAVLDYEGGLASYHRNEPWRQGVIDHFRYNLRRMVDRAHEAGVPVILVNPAVQPRHPPLQVGAPRRDVGRGAASIRPAPGRGQQVLRQEPPRVRRLPEAGDRPGRPARGHPLRARQVLRGSWALR